MIFSIKSMQLTTCLSLLLCVAAALHAQMPESVIHEKNLDYSNVGGRMSMDVVRPKTPSAELQPAVLLIHGGGFRAGSRDTYLPTAAKLAEKGFVAATV